LAGAPSLTPLGDLTALPQTLYSWFKGRLCLRRGKGTGEKGKEWGREGKRKQREGE